MSSTSIQLKEVLGKMTIIDHAEKRLNELKATLTEMNQQWHQMESQLDKELRDVEKLESLSMKALFHKVLGSKEEQIEKERQEYLALSLKHKELNDSIKIVEYEAQVLQGKVGGKEALVKTFNQLKQIREAEILRANEESKPRLLKVIKEEEDTQRLQVEIQQALHAGKAALESLRQVLKHLDKAREWGEWDMMNRSGYYDHMKHSAIDHAAKEAYQAKQRLAMFRNELADIGYNENSFNFNVESFSKFTDVFFDNLISDWIMQQKIKNVLSNVESTFDKVAIILKALDKFNADQENRLTKLSQERESIIIQG